uniref:Secreted protein n=1 Tax=Anguilla anguilla TaxID=7936 RepID=A0A0E9WYG9_ANGAN
MFWSINRSKFYFSLFSLVFLAFSEFPKIKTRCTNIFTVNFLWNLSPHCKPMINYQLNINLFCMIHHSPFLVNLK